MLPLETCGERSFAVLAGHQQWQSTGMQIMTDFQNQFGRFGKWQRRQQCDLWKRGGLGDGRQ